MNEPKDFQKATARHILNLYKNGQKRVLLSDEVGLGKTTVAKTVVEMVKEWHKEMGDDYFKVVYICSNQNIATQNLGNLGIDIGSDKNKKLSITDYRLSVLHQLIYEDRKRKEGEFGKDVMLEQIIPLTPATSFQLKNGQGMMKERALLYFLMSHLEELSDLKEQFRMWFKVCGKDENWNSWIDSYEQGLVNETEYIHDIITRFKSKLNSDNTLLDDLKESIVANHDANYKHNKAKILTRIRNIFAEISIDMLEPDLVIMDEFQRFKDLIHSDSEEEQMLVQRFFNNQSRKLDNQLLDTKVLLLSATPYKPYSTLEELNTEGQDQHYKDFMELMEFLYSAEDYKNFKEVWERYKQALLLGDKSVLMKAKEDAENILLDVMARTERFNSGILKENISEIKIDGQDISSYIEAQALLNELVAPKRQNFPIEYIKSSPYILSFMDRYKIKTECFEKNRKKVNLTKTQNLLIPNDMVRIYRSIPYETNARLKYLYELFFGEASLKPKEKNDAEFLLWVPASRPYYKVDENCVFAKQKSFSKAIIFSGWEMVPRMISVMMSYYAEQLTIGKIKHTPGFSSERIPAYFNTSDEDDEPKKQKGYGVSRLVKTGGSLLEKPYKKLSDAYNPTEYIGLDIKEIKDIVSNHINNLLPDEETVRRSINSSVENVEQLLDCLEDNSVNYPETIPNDILEILTNMAIASPGVCAYRCLSYIENDVKRREEAEKVADAIITLFNRSIGAAIIDNLYGFKNADRYYENVLNYCVMGNLQAVLDEYRYLSGSSFVENIERCGKRKSSILSIDSRESFESGEHSMRMRMRTHFAVAFASESKSEEGVDRVTSLRTAFNSPFRPFILSTTSVGQEGLDFHWYARKIIHWNLPSNPVDLEQREGRINRYNCLAIRRNIAHLFGENTELKTWDDIFTKAESCLNSDKTYSQIVPHWCLPPEWQQLLPEDKQEKIERIVPIYPFSRDKMSYDRLIKVLSLYRLTLGQPRQEELIKLLEKFELTEEEQRQLLMDLSPYNKSNCHQS